MSEPLVASYYHGAKKRDYQKGMLVAKAHQREKLSLYREFRSLCAYSTSNLHVIILCPFFAYP